MILSLSIELPDDTEPSEVAAYLRENAHSAAGQIEQSIINLPAVDESILIHIDDEAQREASLFRSE